MPNNVSFEKIALSPLEVKKIIEGRELLERFQATKTKIAIQKDGALTDIARKIILDAYDIEVPKSPKGRFSVEVSDDGETGFVYARNKSICNLVAEGAVDMAVVGTDRLIEDEAENRVAIINSYQDSYSWSLVLATPALLSVSDPREISRVATQYPLITKRYFESMGQFEVEVEATVGGTELYPYLRYGERQIDAVVDLVATGESLAAHDLVPWTPAIGEVYPVLIQRQPTFNEEEIRNANSR